MARMRTRMPKGVITIAMAASERGRGERKGREVNDKVSAERRLECDVSGSVVLADGN